MGKRRHRRRPSGHPAKVAARGARDSVRQSRRTDEGALDHTARRVCRDASELGGAFEAELWASGLLGTLWKHRFDVPPAELDDPALLLGRPLVDAVARHGGAGARVALSVIERVDDGALGVLAGELAHKLSAAFDPLPAWVGSVGDAEIERTAVMREDVFDDGFTVFIDARHPGDGRHAVGVYVDNNLGLMAKDILLADSIARVEQVMQERPDPHGELRIEPLEPAAAAGHVHAAIELTDMTLGAPVGEDYAGLRALALLRADEIPGPSVEPERPDLTGEERERLCEEFLAAPEGRVFESDGDEAYVASLAIDFCADYVDGRPLRWSPVVVELFMADWIPRKVLADAAFLERVPAVLDAWIRFAGRRAGAPGWAIEQSRDAVRRWRDEMVRRGGDADAGGPAKRLLTAAKEASVDLEDPDAVDTFVAGWNAHSEAP